MVRPIPIQIKRHRPPARRSRHRGKARQGPLGHSHCEPRQVRQSGRRSGRELHSGAAKGRRRAVVRASVVY